MENAIDEWSSGTHVVVPFSSADYRAVYQSHLSMLKTFNEATQHVKILEKLQKDIFLAGW